MNIFVYVATTQGLVAIQGIEPEDEDVQSVVCLNGSFEELPITSAYRQFVKKGSGLIHKDFGCGAFRVDVSGRIDQGHSWQLGFYLAHYLLDKGHFCAGEPQPGDWVVWATGEVKADKSVAAVGGIDSKFKQSIAQLELWQSQGVKTLAFVPESNQQEVAEAVTALLDVNGVAQLSQALALLDELAVPPQMAKVAVDVSEPVVKTEPVVKSELVNLRWLWASLSLVIFAATGWFGYDQWQLARNITDDGQHPVTAVKNDSATMVQTAFSFTALIRQGNSCARSSKMSLFNHNLRLKPYELSQLCDLYIELENPNDHILAIALDTSGWIPIRQIEQRWHVALPKVKNYDRHYVLLQLDKSLVEQVTQVLSAKMLQQSSTELSIEQLQQWIAQQSWSVILYQHTLQDRDW